MYEFDMFINGKWIKSSEKMEVTNPYNNEVCGVVSKGREEDLENAISSAHHAFSVTKKFPTYLRVEVLKHIAKRIKEERDAFAGLIALEAGKPLKYALGEADRAVNTFTIAAEEASRIYGEYLPLDLLSSSRDRFAITKRFPRGPVGGISPFNFPLNLVAHKIAPAIACGNPVVLKPSSKTPMTALKLAGIIEETDWPEGGVNVLPCPSHIAEKLAEDERIKILSFTGSPDVGWHLKKLAVKKQVTLELGGNAGAIVHNDCELDFAVKRCVFGSFAYSGQVCISLQRIYVHEDIYKEFISRFLEETKKLNYGDPLNKETDMGPMITPSALKEKLELIKEAKKDGAEIICGGGFKDNYLEPSVLTSVKHNSRISCEEAFAPIVCIVPYNDFSEGVSLVNKSRYGLQCGIFTKDIKKVFYAFEEIEAGGVIVNDVPTYRIDHMPYGGVKDSGFGREGLRYAIEEMTELKLLAINNG